MKHHAFRLTYGMDLRQGIEDYCRDNDIHSAAIVTVVGCVYRARIRLADGETIEEYDDRYEIVSLTGTVSPDGSHMHVSLADEDGRVIGGHMCNGCLVNTTAEVVLVSLDEEYRFSREYDDSTGYDELVIRKRQY
ncbi:MAG: DNA-binding protein [Erysipelotrichaceae bacterium]|nr:DNA-binding protein [Erysipelotrichaceae bacterium]MBR2599509.1 DNA-binding protein [Erysipelotrichaceae bacterium]